MKGQKLLNITFGTLLALAAAGCSNTVEIQFDRIPRNPVYVPFTTAGTWDIYGCSAALSSRRFIRPSEPAGYTYQDYSYTGYGGVLLVSDVTSTPRAYDLSCPVERQRDIRIQVDYDTDLARCPKCGSTYDVFVLNGSMAGAPVSGPALTSGYGLRGYQVVFGVDGRYALVTQ